MALRLRVSPPFLAVLVVAGALGVAVVSTSCSGDEPQPGEPQQDEALSDHPTVAPTVPPTVPTVVPVSKPATEGTAVRFRCALPDEVRPEAKVAAWWRADPSDVNRIHRGTWDGAYLTIDVPPGPGFVSIHVAGCVVVRRAVDASVDGVTDAGVLALTRCTILRGRVIDESGAPIDDAFLYPKAGDLSVPLEGTNEDGTFSFDGLPDGEVRLRVTSDRFVRMIVVVPNGAGAVPAEIVMKRGGGLRGVVLGEDGQPAPDARVWVIDPRDEKNRNRMAWPHVEDDGTFSVRLAPGRYKVNAQAGPRSSSLMVDVQDGKTLEVTIPMSR